MLNIRVLILILLILFQFNTLNAKIIVKFKVGDEIVTNIDIFNEKKYLIFLRPDLENLKEEELINLAERSIIKEIIKKKEIKKIFNDDNPKINEQVKKKLLNLKKSIMKKN